MLYDYTDSCLPLSLLSLFPSSLVVVNENVSLVISRQLLTDFCTHLPNLPDSTAKAIYHFTLEKIQPRVISFEEQVSAAERSPGSIPGVRSLTCSRHP